MRKEVDMIDKIKNFVKEVNDSIQKFNVQNLYNSDQSGFNLEIHSGKTLTFVGGKNIESLVQSISSMTHSYTIQMEVFCQQC